MDDAYRVPLQQRSPGVSESDGYISPVTSREWIRGQVHEIMRARARSWAQFMVLTGLDVSYGFDGPFKVRPAAAAVLSAETMRAFHLENSVRMKYGTVVACFDPAGERVLLIAQPVWRGML